MSGTAPSPMDRAAVAGKVETMSSVAVNRMEMMSSSTSPLRSRISPSRATTRVGDGVGGVRVDGGGAADGSDGRGHQPGMLLRGLVPAALAGAGPRPRGTAAAARPRTSSMVRGR